MSLIQSEKRRETLRQKSCIHPSLGTDCVVWVLAITLAATKDRQVSMPRVDSYLPMREIACKYGFIRFFSLRRIVCLKRGTKKLKASS